MTCSGKTGLAVTASRNQEITNPGELGNELFPTTPRFPEPKQFRHLETQREPREPFSGPSGYYMRTSLNISLFKLYFLSGLTLLCVPLASSLQEWRKLNQDAPLLPFRGVDHSIDLVDPLLRSEKPENGSATRTQRPDNSDTPVRRVS
jgi:hypothetical protein